VLVSPLDLKQHQLNQLPSWGPGRRRAAARVAQQQLLPQLVQKPVEMSRMHLALVWMICTGNKTCCWVVQAGLEAWTLAGWTLALPPLAQDPYHRWAPAAAAVLVDMWNNVLYTTRLSGAFVALMIEAADSLPAGWSSVRHTNSTPTRHNTRLQSMLCFLSLASPVCFPFPSS